MEAEKQSAVTLDAADRLLSNILLDFTALVTDLSVVVSGLPNATLKQVLQLRTCVTWKLKVDRWSILLDFWRIQGRINEALSDSQSKCEFSCRHATVASLDMRQTNEDTACVKTCLQRDIIINLVTVNSSGLQSVSASFNYGNIGQRGQCTATEVKRFLWPTFCPPNVIQAEILTMFNMWASLEAIHAPGNV